MIHDKKALQAIGLTLLGFSLYSILDTAGKTLQQTYETIVVFWAGQFIMTLILGSIIFFQSGKQGFIPKIPMSWHVGRSILVIGLAGFALISLKHMPLADYYGVIFTNPLMFIALCALILHEHICRDRWIAVAVGFFGVLIMIMQDLNGGINIGYLAAFGTAICLAINSLVLRAMGGRNEHPLRVVFYPSIFIGIGSFAFAFPYLQNINLEDWWLWLIYGSGMAFGTLCLATAFKITPQASLLAPFQYIPIIWGTLFGWIFFNDIPTAQTMLGAAIVIAAGLYVIYKEKTV